MDLRCADCEHDLRSGCSVATRQANASVALGIVAALDGAGIARARRPRSSAGLRQRPLAGPPRAHPRRRATDVLLDGAHNPAGMAALAAALGELRPSSSEPLTVLMGTLANHWQDGMLDPLKRRLARRRH